MPARSHGLSRTPEYNALVAAIRRCHDEAHPRFALYGARGVVVCAEWRSNPQAFIDHVGKRPSAKHSLERIDNALGYVPGNVRWATQGEQLRNTKRTKMITFRGRTQCLTDWAKELRLPFVTLYHRLNKLAWSVEKALTTPVSEQHSRAQRGLAEV